MKNLTLILSALIITTLVNISCSSDPDDQTICYSFDQKQCGFDSWADANSGDDLDIRVTNYLKSQSIIPVQFKVDEAFHQVTCAACEVCPDAPRFYIEISEADKSKIEALGLLSLMNGDCSIIF